MMLAQCASRSGNITRQAAMEVSYGVLEDNRNHWKQAVPHYAKAAKLFHEANDLIGEATACNFAAVSCFDANDYDKCILFAKKQRYLASKMLKKDSSIAGEHYCTALNNEGLAHRSQGHPELAQACHLKMLGFSQNDDHENLQGDEEKARMGAESLANGHLALDMLMKSTTFRGKGKRGKRSKKNQGRKNQKQDGKRVGSNDRHHQQMLLKQESENNLHRHLNTTLNNTLPSSIEPASTLQSRLTLGVLSIQKGEYAMAKSYSTDALSQARCIGNKNLINGTGVHVGIAKGQLRLEAMLLKMKETMNQKLSAPLALRNMVRQARYGQMKEKEDDIVFGKGEIIYK